MIKPSLSAFGLSELDMRRAKSLRKVLIVLSVLWCVVGLGIAAHTNDDWLFFATVPPLGPFIFYKLLEALTGLVSSPFRKAMLFEKAVERYEQWWRRTRSEFWLRLSGRRFEVELAALYRRCGYDVELTAASDDGGVDIWLTREGKRLAVQCKAHRRPVGPNVIRELYGTMKHFGISAGVVASLSGFTQGAAICAAGKKIELLNLNHILEMQRQHE